MSESANNSQRVIAVPSLGPEGLNAERSAHFGHCGYFTLVKVDESGNAEVSTVENTPHSEGGCLAPVQLLADNGATDIIVGGMGARPLAYFGEMGITVYADQELPQVGQVVEAFLQGKVAEISPMNVCGGGGGNCH
jgi:predicted Fe-Mo cluster-binding NifX family protein